MPSHQPEHDRLPALRGFEVLDGVVARRRLRQPGQQGALGQVKLPRMDAEIRLGRRLDAGGEVAVVGGVEVERQQLILGVRPLQPPRQPRLAQLAAQRALRALCFGR